MPTSRGVRKLWCSVRHGVRLAGKLHGSGVVPLAEVGLQQKLLAMHTRFC